MDALGGEMNYTAMVRDWRIMPWLAGGLVHLKAGGKADCIRQFLHLRISFCALPAKTAASAQSSQCLFLVLSQITKSIPICSESSTIRRYTFLNTIMMLEMLKSFIPECLCFTLCRADPHSIHGRLQQRQIMVEFWVLGGWLIKTLQTHFINVSKSYLRCGTQRQSSRGALMHNTMFSGKMCLQFILKKN